MIKSGHKVITKGPARGVRVMSREPTRTISGASTTQPVSLWRAKRVVKDVVCVLRLGRVHVIKLLLDVRRDLLAGDLSLLVRVWIEDLLCWLQSLPDAAADQFLPAVAAAVEAARVTKRDLGFAVLQQQ